jgi:hypothetical protein
MASIPEVRAGESQDLVVAVDVRNAADETVVRAEVTMWVTPRPSAEDQDPSCAGAYRLAPCPASLAHST